MQEYGANSSGHPVSAAKKLLRNDNLELPGIATMLVRWVWLLICRVTGVKFIGLTPVKTGQRDGRQNGESGIITIPSETRLGYTNGASSVRS